MSATDSPLKPNPIDPFKSPSYPQRVHAKERPYWQGLLRQCEERIAEARRKLDAMGQSADRAPYERAYAQMLGSRDQIAAAVLRLPMEVGDLYEEDKHRVEEAVAAVERISKTFA